MLSQRRHIHIIIQHYSSRIMGCDDRTDIQSRPIQRGGTGQNSREFIHHPWEPDADSAKRSRTASIPGAELLQFIKQPVEEQPGITIQLCLKLTLRQDVSLFAGEADERFGSANIDSCTMNVHTSIPPDFYRLCQRRRFFTDAAKGGLHRNLNGSNNDVLLPMV
ncbi:hypothetical protein D3C73_1213150 [compost metagenome]